MYVCMYVCMYIHVYMSLSSTDPVWHDHYTDIEIMQACLHIQMGNWRLCMYMCVCVCSLHGLFLCCAAWLAIFALE